MKDPSDKTDTDHAMTTTVTGRTLAMPWWPQWQDRHWPCHDEHSDRMDTDHVMMTTLTWWTLTMPQWQQWLKLEGHWKWWPRWHQEDWLCHDDHSNMKDTDRFSSNKTRSPMRIPVKRVLFSNFELYGSGNLFKYGFKTEHILKGYVAKINLSFTYFPFLKKQ